MVQVEVVGAARFKEECEPVLRAAGAVVVGSQAGSDRSVWFARVVESNQEAQQPRDRPFSWVWGARAAHAASH